jgi:hypothetical protein
LYGPEAKYFLTQGKDREMMQLLERNGVTEMLQHDAHYFDWALEQVEGLEQEEATALREENDDDLWQDLVGLFDE